MSQLSKNVPNISKCSNYLKMSQLAISKCSNFHQRVNFMKKYYLDKNQDCAEICKMTEFMQNYAENLKYVKMCG